jgi:hypothetical protein
MLAQDKRYGQLYVPGLLLNKSKRYQDNPMKHKMHQLFLAHAASEAREGPDFTGNTRFCCDQEGARLPAAFQPCTSQGKRRLLHQFLKV